MGDLVDLVGEDGLHGPEMVETDLDADVLAAIARLAPRLRAGLARVGKLHDCWRAAPLWHSELIGRGIDAVLLNAPDPEDAHWPDFSRVADEERGGYEVDGGLLKRHAWLAVGQDLLVFDPTAHQFEGCGRAALWRYWCQERGARLSFRDWRIRERDYRGAF